MRRLGAPRTPGLSRVIARPRTPGRWLTQRPHGSSGLTVVRMSAGAPDDEEIRKDNRTGIIFGVVYTVVGIALLILGIILSGLAGLVLLIVGLLFLAIGIWTTLVWGFMEWLRNFGKRFREEP